MTIVAPRLAIIGALLLAACTPAEPAPDPRAAAVYADLTAPTTRTVRRCADGKTTVRRTASGRYVWGTWVSGGLLGSSGWSGDWLPDNQTPTEFCT